MKVIGLLAGLLLQLALFAAMAYGVLLVGGATAMGWFLILAPIPLTLIGFFSVRIK